MKKTSIHWHDLGLLTFTISSSIALVWAATNNSLEAFMTFLFAGLPATLFFCILDRPTGSQRQTRY